MGNAKRREGSLVYIYDWRIIFPSQQGGVTKFLAKCLVDFGYAGNHDYYVVGCVAALLCQYFWSRSH